MKKDFEKMSVKELMAIRYDQNSKPDDVIAVIKILEIKKPEAVLPCRNYQ